MKLRLLPILVSVVISSAVLFGGWFAYHSFAMENPLNKMVSSAPGVVKDDIQISNDAVDIHVTLKPEASLREIYQKIEQDGKSIIGNRKVTVHVDNEQTSPELDQWWSSVLFDVAQAMDTKQYSEIPKTLKAHAPELQGVHYVTQMDESNVYIQLTCGKYNKYIVLPRTPDRMGVFPNE